MRAAQEKLTVNCVCHRLLTHLDRRFGLRDVCRASAIGSAPPQPWCHSSRESFTLSSDVTRARACAGEGQQLFAAGRRTTRSLGLDQLRKVKLNLLFNPN